MSNGFFRVYCPSTSISILLEADSFNDVFDPENVTDLLPRESEPNPLSFIYEGRMLASESKIGVVFVKELISYSTLTECVIYN